MASELDAELGREWANELFALSAQAKPDQRSVLRNSALGILVRLDPNRALELLHGMATPESQPTWNVRSAKMGLARRVFMTLVERNGTGALPLLEQEAERMGTEGQYPYSALGYAAMQSVNKDWGNNKQHAVDVLRSVFEPMFASYSQGTHGYRDDFEFGQMLKVLAGGLPLEVIQPALHALVKNLLAVDTSQYHFRADLYTSDGKKTSTENTVEAGMIFFGSLINRDPELVQQLETARPELRIILEYTANGRERSVSFGPFGARPGNQLPPDQTAQARMDAVGISHSNADAAIEKLEQLPDDDKRANAMLEVARSIAGDHAEQAAKLIEEAQAGNRTVDERWRLNVISAQASVAAAQDKPDELRDLLRRGFKLAVDPAFGLQSSDASPRLIAGLAPLVQIGAQNDPDVTITFLQSLSPSSEKAQLLMAAAEALKLRARLPFRSGARQRP